MKRTYFNIIVLVAIVSGVPMQAIENIPAHAVERSKSVQSSARKFGSKELIGCASVLSAAVGVALLTHNTNLLSAVATKAANALYALSSPLTTVIPAEISGFTAVASAPVKQVSTEVAKVTLVESALQKNYALFQACPAYWQTLKSGAAKSAQIQTHVPAAVKAQFTKTVGTLKAQKPQCLVCNVGPFKDNWYLDRHNLTAKHLKNVKALEKRSL